jgi:hypothetical protein
MGLSRSVRLFQLLVYKSLFQFERRINAVRNKFNSISYILTFHLTHERQSSLNIDH